MAHGRVDGNQAEIIEAFEKAGARVALLSNLGRGVPDLLIGTTHSVALVEVKNPQSAYGKRGLNKRQRRFVADGWPVDIVRTTEEALAVVARLRKADAEYVFRDSRGTA